MQRKVCCLHYREPLSRCGVGFDTMQARLSPARIELILTTVRRVREGLSLTVKQFQTSVWTYRGGIRASPCLEDGAALSYIFSEESWGSAGPFGGPFLSRLCARYGESFFCTLVRGTSLRSPLGTTACVLQAFCPPHFREPDQEKLNCMCPLGALDAYVHRTACGERRTNC